MNSEQRVNQCVCHGDNQQNSSPLRTDIVQRPARHNTGDNTNNADKADPTEQILSIYDNWTKLTTMS